MPTGKKIFGFLILLAFIAIVVFIILGKINPGLNIISEVLSGSVAGIVIIILGLVVVIAIIRFFKISMGRRV